MRIEMNNQTTKHTPGPWLMELTGWTTTSEGNTGQSYTISVTKDFDRIPIANITAKNTQRDDTFNRIHYTNEECEANARLIAAAPDMLELLGRALPTIDAHISTLEETVEQQHDPETVLQAQHKLITQRGLKSEIEHLIAGF